MNRTSSLSAPRSRRLSPRVRIVSDLKIWFSINLCSSCVLHFFFIAVYVLIQMFVCLLVYLSSSWLLRVNMMEITLNF